MNTKPSVSIVRGDVTEAPDNYTEKDLSVVKDMIRRSFELIGGIDEVVGEASYVILKPNLVEVPFETTKGSVITDPRVLEALGSILKKHGVERVVVAEGKSVNLKHIESGPRKAFKASGLEEVITRAGGEILGWDEEPFVNVPVPGGEILDTIGLPASILEADLFINVPKLKTHCQTEITIGIKALQGVFSAEDKIKFHTEAFPWKMADILRVAKPHLTIVDGLICGQGYGPIYTEPIDMNTIVASTDVVAVDAVCSAIMGIDPIEVPITRLAHSEGLGVGVLSQIDVAGESIEDVKTYFKRSGIWNPIGYTDKIRIFAGDSCRFVLAQLGAAVKRLELEGLLDDLEEICVIVGHNPPVPVKEYKNVYVVGDSAKDCGIDGYFIPGAPPLPSVSIVNLFKRHLKSKVAAGDFDKPSY